MAASAFDNRFEFDEIQDVVDVMGGGNVKSVAQRQANALVNLGLAGGTAATPGTLGQTAGIPVTPGTAQAGTVVVLDANKSFSGMVSNPNVIDANGATLLLTSQNNGATVLLDRAAGCTVTLPAPAAGLNFTFVVKVVPTSTAYKIITSAGTIFITGGLNFDKALTVTRYDGNATSIVSINLNGTTTGGAAIGDTFTLSCVTPTLWTASGTVMASGTLATPFATS
jgi:hypothetical protein